MVTIARCGCGQACGCSLTSNPAGGTTVTGSGTPANPWQVSVPIKNCTDVRACLSGNQGVTFNPATGAISACISTNAGNGLTRDGAGCLYVGAGASTVTTGCGITGTGAPASPVRANTQTWPYACDPLTQGGVVSCDPSGVLVGEPRSRSMMQTTFFDQDYPNTAVPATATQTNQVATVTMSVTNPDPCRSSINITMQEVAVTLQLPAGARAEYGFDADNMVQHTNRGAATETDFYVQVSKTVNRAVIGPGATVNNSFGVFLGLGTNGATYTHIQGILRTLTITQ